VGERHSRRIPQEVKIAVSARDGGVCRQCGSTEKLQFDHIIPASKGGANTVANIQLLCGRCNRAKAAK
jgi:5-methylcytosine-specific restriction endonuclease McrA